MTPADKAQIKRLAKKAGMTVTDYIVACSMGKEIVRVEGLDDILTELKAQGRNLNQLPHWPTWASSRSSVQMSSLTATPTCVKN